MRYLRRFNEKIEINLNDISLVEVDAIGKFKHSTGGKVLKCFYDNKVISYIEYYIFQGTTRTKELSKLFDSEVYISFVKTEDDYKRNGIANLLIKEVINISKKIGVEVITLKIDIKDYDFLKRQYERIGFVLFDDYMDNSDFWENSNKMILVLNKNLK